MGSYFTYPNNKKIKTIHQKPEWKINLKSLIEDYFVKYNKYGEIHNLYEKYTSLILQKYTNFEEKYYKIKYVLIYYYNTNEHQQKYLVIRFIYYASIAQILRDDINCYSHYIQKLFKLTKKHNHRFYLINQAHLRCINEYINHKFTTPINIPKILKKILINWSIFYKERHLLEYNNKHLLNDDTIKILQPYYDKYYIRFNMWPIRLYFISAVIRYNIFKN